MAAGVGTITEEEILHLWVAHGLEHGLLEGLGEFCIEIDHGGDARVFGLDLARLQHEVLGLERVVGGDEERLPVATSNLSKWSRNSQATADCL